MAWVERSAWTSRVTLTLPLESTTAVMVGVVPNTRKVAEPQVLVSPAS